MQDWRLEGSVQTFGLSLSYRLHVPNEVDSHAYGLKLGALGIGLDPAVCLRRGGIPKRSTEAITDALPPAGGFLGTSGVPAPRSGRA